MNCGQGSGASAVLSVGCCFVPADLLFFAPSLHQLLSSLFNLRPASLDLLILLFFFVFPPSSPLLRDRTSLTRPPLLIFCHSFKLFLFPLFFLLISIFLFYLLSASNFGLLFSPLIPQPQVSWRQTSPSWSSSPWSSSSPATLPVSIRFSTQRLPAAVFLFLVLFDNSSGLKKKQKTAGNPTEWKEGILKIYMDP